MNILRNPVYTGTVIWNRRRFLRSGGQSPGCRKIENNREQWVVTHGKHPAIVTQELFDRVQARMRARSKPSGTGRELVNPFAGLIRCANCGGLMQLRPRANRPGGYLLCERAGCCPSCDFSDAADTLRNALRPLLRRIPIQPAAPDPCDQKREYLLLKAEKRLRTQEGRLCTLLESGIYSPALYEERRRILLAQREKLSEQLCRLPAAPDNPQRTKDFTAEDALDGASPAEENRLWRLLVRSILCRSERGPDGHHVSFEIQLRCSPDV